MRIRAIKDLLNPNALFAGCIIGFLSWIGLELVHLNSVSAVREIQISVLNSKVGTLLEQQFEALEITKGNQIKLEKTAIAIDLWDKDGNKWRESVEDRLWRLSSGE